MVLLTDHSAFDYDLIVRNARVILDTRNAFARYSRPNIVRLGAPLPSVAAGRSYRQTPVGEAAAAVEEN